MGKDPRFGWRLSFVAVGGAEAHDGGAVEISAGTVKNNASGSGGVAGIAIGAGGHLRVIGGGSTVVSNTHSGIQVIRGGTAVVDGGAMIASNGSDGLHIFEGSAGTVRGSSIVQGNGANGIYVESGNVTVGDAVGPVTIQNNKQNGIFMRTNSVATFENTTNKISANTDWGILCTGSPSNPLLYETLGALGTVSGNGKGQISCKVSP